MRQKSIEEKTEMMNGSHFKVPDVVFERGPILTFQETWEIFQQNKSAPSCSSQIYLLDYTWYSQLSHKATGGIYMA